MSEIFDDFFRFGGAFTDAAGINIAHLSPEAQESLIRAYYSDQGDVRWFKALSKTFYALNMAQSGPSEYWLNIEVSVYFTHLVCAGCSECYERVCLKLDLNKYCVKRAHTQSMATLNFEWYQGHV